MRDLRGLPLFIVSVSLLLCVASLEAVASRALLDPPRSVRSGWWEPPGEARAALLDQLRAAKERGDMEAARALARQVEGAPDGGMNDASSGVAEFQIPSYVRGARGDGEFGSRWSPDDVVVAETEFHEINPTLVGATQGDLYLSCELADAATLLYYRSTAGGEQWEPWRILQAPEFVLDQQTVAIGEGNERWLVGAHVVDGMALVSWRESLSSDAYDTQLVWINPEGISHPRITTDAAEFPAWFAYAVYNVRTPDGWAVVLSRSLDFGWTWEPPVIVGRYCPGWDASGARPDVAFGSGILYVAYSSPSGSCDEESREVYLTRSLDYGVNWEPPVALTENEDAETEPAIAAIRACADEPTVFVSYSRRWDGEDHDVWSANSEDAGESWETNLCLSCIEQEDERTPDMEASCQEGGSHVAFWHDGRIDYARAKRDEPDEWEMHRHVNQGQSVSSEHRRPAVGVDPTRPVEEEAGIVWVDRRNWGSTGYDLYYDGPAASATLQRSGDDRERIALVCTPNPSSEGATIQFDLPRPGFVELSIHDAAGRRIRTLAAGEHRAGRTVVRWDGSGAADRRLRTGVYFVRLAGVSFTTTRTVTLLR
ncbi:MAG: T9SS type A sorting domain-containing protein [Candidatus Eisenbacteria bacterium]|nr:T9SS type A sorting domain-containing protein [Candidatus Latescibacterota bacterium]MBD3301124.1 T9SS type A sorting domain-containing protein [Candidatus Eisenbacteria bacterium]